MDKRAILLVRKIAENYYKFITKEMGIENVFPVDMDSIIKYINGNIIERKDLVRSNIKYINKGTPPAFEIHIYKHNNEKARRFYLAKELGYLILYMDFFDEEARKTQSDDFYKTFFLNAIKEIHAIEFERCFLMPSEVFDDIGLKTMIKKGSENYYNIKALEDYFGVLNIQVVERGISLCLFEARYKGKI